VTGVPRFACFLIVVGIALCLYLPFLTRNYDLNGLTEATALENGRLGDLLNPNHMLYRPIGYVVRKALADLGITLGAVPILQVLSAIFGALGVGFAYLALESITTNRAVAVAISLLLAVSWSYWTLSTDVYYFTLAAMLVAAALWMFVRSESNYSYLACGILAGLAILACEANLCLPAGLAVAVAVRRSDLGWRRVIQRIGLVGIGTVLVAGVAFVAVGMMVYEKRNVAELLRWSSSYSGGNTLAMWGAWSPGRGLAAAGSAFKSIVGMELWMFQFFLRHLRNGELPRWVAPLGLMALVAVLVAVFFRSAPNEKMENRTALGLLAIYGAYMPFIIWWEPVEPRWFIFPNIFLAALVAIGAARWAGSRSLSFVVPGVVVLLALFNFATSVWPRRFHASVPSQMAACVAGHMSPKDLFVATEWNWAGYLPSVHNREMLSVIGEVSRAGNKSSALQTVHQAVAERQRQGGHVYMMDFRSYEPSYMKWLGEQTGVTASDLQVYTGSRTFQCVYSNFFELDPL
jgi:hypothetical protein